MSKVTVVSLYPLPIDEYKPGLYPGHFHFDGAKDGDLSLLVLEDSCYWVHFPDEERPSIKMNVPSKEVAASLINDFVNNLYGVNLVTGSMPGLFQVDGQFTKDEIQKKFTAELQAARVRQVKWYTRVVELADSDWVASGNKPTAISSVHRLACQALGFDRPWLVIMDEAGPKYCPVCRTKVHPTAIVCSSCRAVLDEKRYATVKFAGGN
jgi:hypothetical protein